MSVKQMVSHPGRKLALAQNAVSPEEDIRRIDVWHLIQPSNILQNKDSAINKYSMSW